jgi:hypothetical protein
MNHRDIARAIQSVSGKRGRASNSRVIIGVFIVAYPFTLESLITGRYQTPRIDAC